MELGNLSSVKWFQGIGEYKINWGPGYRIYLARDSQRVLLLLGGGTKKSQKTDIRRALLLWKEYQVRKAARRKGK